MSLKHGLLGLLNYENIQRFSFSILAGADKPNLPGVKHNGKAGMAYIGNCNTDR